MKKAQKTVHEFNEARLWNTRERMKDMLLNITEETGEIWNIIKWVKEDDVPELIDKNHDDFEDFIGQMLYITYKLANWSNVDCEKAFKRTMDEFETRFPIDKIKGHHANINAGGYDGKYKGE